MQKKNFKVTKKYNIRGNQFYELKYKNGLAIFWEDNEVLCVPIIRVINDDERGKGIGQDIFHHLESLAKGKNKIFQISDVPSMGESKGAMRHILNKNNYHRFSKIKDNWGNDDTVAMWRKEGKGDYSIRKLINKHLLIYDYYYFEPEVKLKKCWLCNANMDGYICSSCGLCQRCQCRSFSKNSCHLCENGHNEAKANYKCKTTTFKF